MHINSYIVKTRKLWNRKTTFRIKTLNSPMSMRHAAIRCFLVITVYLIGCGGLFFYYHIYNHIEYTRRPKIKQELAFLSSNNILKWLKKVIQLIVFNFRRGRFSIILSFDAYVWQKTISSGRNPFCLL